MDNNRPAPTDILLTHRLIDGKYQLGRLLGEGGMGAVYEAEHTGLGVSVALKLLNDAFITEPTALSRFRREARATASIRHENVVTVTDTGTDQDGTPFIVMELLEGESLSALLRREKVLPISIAVQITTQLLAGLSAAHEKAVIHRDLKPGNILLVDRPGGGKLLKILDFGISKMVYGDAMTAAGAVIGTPRFMAPEQARGQSDLDARVDIYAIGVLLYRMVTGKLPFTAASSDQILRQILQGKIIPPRSIRKSVPESLQQIILTAMATDRDNRYPDTFSMMQALAEAVPEANVSTLHISSLPSRPTGTTAGVSGLPILDPMAAVAATAPARPASRPDSLRTSPAAKMGAGRRLVLLLILLVFAAGGAAGGWFLWGKSGKTATNSGDAGLGTGPQNAMGNVFRLGITRYLPEKVLRKEHQRLLNYLTNKLGRVVQVSIFEDYVDLADQLASGKLQFVALSAYDYVLAKKRHPSLQLLATHVTAGGPSYAGLIISRADSGINELKQLRDKKFCYVGVNSTSGYLYPRAIFRRAGMDPDKSFSSIRYTGDHLSSLRAVYSKACDGASVFAGILYEGKKHQMPPQLFNIVASTDRIPYDAYCASDSLNPMVRNQLRDALLSLVPRSDLAQQTLGTDSRVIGFVGTKDADYDSVRRIHKYLDKSKPKKTGRRRKIKK
jgi:eukaryotic-like serine/threonine-protein kinase